MPRESRSLSNELTVIGAGVLATTSASRRDISIYLLATLVATMLRGRNCSSQHAGC